MHRRDFIKTTAAGSLSAPFISLSLLDKLFGDETLPDAVWVENGEPKDLLNNTLKNLGGIERFVSKDETVVIKPNIGWDRSPQYAATTNPDLISGLVRMCLDAGAKTVKVFDRTCNNSRRCYRNSEIEEKAADAGAEVIQVRKNRYQMISVDGKLISEWPIYEDYLEADKVINVPVAKHHSLSRVTLGLKNLMGVMGGNRGEIHNHFAVKLTDINRHILPTLTIIDAYRILTQNGPVGGNLGHVRLTKTLIASPCTVTADYLALELFNLKLHQVEHVKYAAESGLVRFNLDKLNIKRITLS